MRECERCHEKDARVCVSCVVEVTDDVRNPRTVACRECGKELMRISPLEADVDFVLSLYCPCGARFGYDPGVRESVK